MPQALLGRQKDVFTPRLIASLQKDKDCDYSFPVRYVSRAVLCAGETPSYGFLSSPMKGFGPGEWDETIPSVALQRQGPAGAVKLITRAAISYLEGKSTLPLLHGWLVSHSHQIGEDSLISEIYDDRYTFGKYTCFGKMMYNPEISRHWFDLSARLEFNQFGYPDCLDTPYGPRFAPGHRYGYRNHFDVEDTQEPDPGYATDRARSWRCADAFRYLRDMFYIRDGDFNRPPVWDKVNPGNLDLPTEIIWPETLGSVEGADRFLRGFSPHNKSLLQTLQALARKAGAYDIYLSPEGEWSSRLELLDMNPKSFTGAVLVTAKHAKDIGEAMNSPVVVHDGHIVESAKNYFHSVGIIGDPPAVEKMCAMKSRPTTPSGPGAPIGIGSLQPAWSVQDEIEFKAWIVAHGNDGQAFSMACKLYPMVYCAYRVTGAHDPWFGTKWEGTTNSGFKRVKPNQLTGYQQDSSSPKNWVPREIIVESYRDQVLMHPDHGHDDPPLQDSKWEEGGRFDGLTLSPDGTIILLPGLRDAGMTYIVQTWLRGHEDATAWDGRYMFPLDIRIQLAIEADWPLMGFNDTDPNRSASRVNAQPHFTYQTCAEEMDYVEYLRTAESRPIGEIGFRDKAPWILSRFPPRALEGNELFTDRVNATTGREPSHALKRLQDVKRVEYNGLLVVARLAPAYRPGLNVSLVSGDSLPCYGVLKSVVFDMDLPKVGSGSVIELGPPDSQTIYDAPQPMKMISYNSGSGTAKENPDPYENEVVPQLVPAAQDDYEKAEAVRDAAKRGQGAAPQGAAATPQSAGAGKTPTRLDKMNAALQRVSARGDESSEKASEKIRRDIRKEEKKVERNAGRDAAKALQRGNKGSLGGRSNIMDAFLGKPSRGSIGARTGYEKSNLTDVFLGKASRGSIGKRQAGQLDQNGLGDTRAADAFDNQQSDRNKAAENARMTAQNEAAEKAMGLNFHGQSNVRKPWEAGPELVPGGRQRVPAPNIGAVLQGPPAPVNEPAPPPRRARRGPSSMELRQMEIDNPNG